MTDQLENVRIGARGLKYLIPSARKNRSHWHTLQDDDQEFEPLCGDI